MSPLEWIILATTVGPSLLTLIRGVFGQQKLSRGALIQSGRELAWGVVEGLKKAKPGYAWTVDAMTNAAITNFDLWSGTVGLKLTPSEIEGSKVWWQMRSGAAHAYDEKRKRAATK